MLDKELLSATVAQALEGTDAFVVDIRVTPANEVTVEIDSMTGVDIDICARITRQIEDVFDRDVEDYELEVGSAGLTSPLKVRRQFEKNIGNDLDILTRDGRRIHAVLTNVIDGDDDREVEFVITVATKVKREGAKRPEIVDVEETLRSSDCKSIVYDLKF